MVIRKKINKLLEKLSIRMNIKLIEDIDVKLEESIKNSSFNTLKNKIKKNYLFNLLNDKVIPLSGSQCNTVEHTIYDNLINNSITSPFLIHMPNQYKDLLNNYPLKGILKDLETFVDIKQIMHNIFLSELLKESSRPAWKMEFKIGRKTILLLYNNILNKIEFKKKLEITWDTFAILLKELNKKTPRIFNISNDFVNIDVFLDQTSKEVRNLFIFAYFYYTLFSNKNMKPISKNLMLLLEVIEEDDKYKHWRHINRQELFMKLRAKLLNILNIYAKMIGNACTNMYLDLKIIQLEKQKSTYYIKCPNINLYSFCIDKLPNLYLNTNYNFKSKKFIKKNFDFDLDIHQIYNGMIQKDYMEGTIKSSNIWFKSTGLHMLNLIFIKEFLKNFLYILKKANKQKKEIILNNNQIMFLSAFFDVSFEALQKNNQLLFNKILYYCIDFNNLKAFYLPPEQTTLQITQILNKIKTQKFLLLKIIRDLHILIRVKYFEFNIKYDARGRAYPNTSLFNYHHPQLKYFFTWAPKYFYDFNEPDKLTNIAYNIVKQTDALNLNILPSINDLICQKIDSDLKKTKQNLHIPLIDFCTPNNEKIYETYLSYNDLMNVGYKNYIMSYCYCLDARGSGFQLITMLLNSNTLAEACGMTSNNDDIYTQFVSFFQEAFKFGNIAGHPIMKDLSVNNLIMKLNLLTSTEILEILAGKDMATFKDIYKLFNFTELLKYFPFKGKNFNYLNNLHNLPKFQTLGYFGDPLRYSIERVYEPIKGKKKFFIFVNMLNLFLKNFDDNDDNIFKDFVTRKLVKNAIMTYFYGSATKTRCASMLEQYLNKNLQFGHLCTNEEISKFKKFALKIDKLLRKWLSLELPESLILIKAIKITCKTKQFNPSVISSDHALWHYLKLKQEKYSKTIHYKDFKLKKYTSDLDYNKISTGYLANYIQFCDATLCTKIVAKLKKNNIPVKTTHDCWKVPYCYASYLDSAIYESYIEFIKEDYLKLHYEKSNTFLYNLIIKAKQKYNIIPIDINLIPKDGSSLAKF